MPLSNEPRSRDITQLLVRWTHGDRDALDALMPVVYAELRAIANGYLRRERTGHTLQPTALVHEAWMSLVKQDPVAFEHRKQFFALAAQAMRHILVDHARMAAAGKRGGGAVKTTLSEVAIPVKGCNADDLLALDQGLRQLARVSDRQAQIIELRYFGGLNLDEIADVLSLSPATISRDQRSAEAWLGHLMSQNAR
jgi:RNA polymerase sigma-70 factor, ECF subfamily